MNVDKGCCGHPAQCTVKDGRCKAREDWQKAHGRGHYGERTETRAERRERIREETLRMQAQEKAKGLDLGRTR